MLSVEAGATDQAAAQAASISMDESARAHLAS